MKIVIQILQIRQDQVNFFIGTLQNMFRCILRLPTDLLAVNSYKFAPTGPN